MFTLILAAILVFPVDVVGAYQSNPGESLDEFVIRISEPAMAHTLANDAEVCGQLTSNGEVYGIVLQSNRSQLFCNSDHSAVLNGHSMIGETFHTHPKAHGNNLRLHAESRRTAHVVGRGDHLSLHVVPGFSRADIESGPGYLRYDDKILHQRGPGTTRRVNSP